MTVIKRKIINGSSVLKKVDRFSLWEILDDKFIFSSGIFAIVLLLK